MKVLVFISMLAFVSAMTTEEPATIPPEEEYECACGLFATIFLEDQTPFLMLPNSTMGDACTVGYCRNWCERMGDLWESEYTLSNVTDSGSQTYGEMFCEIAGGPVADRAILTRPRRTDCEDFGGFDPDAAHVSGVNYLCCDDSANWFECPDN